MILPKVCEEARVLHQRSPMAGVYDLTLSAPTIARSARPGQFVEVAVPHGGALLRRPLGIAETSAEAGEIRLIYRVVGRGTELLAAADAGETISVLGPLGHGFNVTYRHPLLVGGGMGLTPLLFFAAAHGSSSVLMGGRTKAELFWEELFRPHVRAVHATTDDGSYGTEGFVTTLLPELLQEGDYFYRIAEPEKALCDQLYTMPPTANIRELSALVFDDLRVEETAFQSLSAEKVAFLAQFYRSTNIRRLATLLRRRLRA